MPGNLNSVLTVQERIAELAQRSPDFTFYSLAHHIDLHWLLEAYDRTRKDGAAGIDDVTGKQYADNLYENLQNLLDRLKGGRYKAPPVKRVHIPKGAGAETRPIGIPTFEDKVLQRAVVMLIEPIYEHDFHDGSYGFRPKRSAHQALEEVCRRMGEKMQLIFPTRRPLIRLGREWNNDKFAGAFNTNSRHARMFH